MLNKNSCFIDALEQAYTISAVWLDAEYQKLLTLSKPEVQGYHPAVIAFILMEFHGLGLIELQPWPSDASGKLLPSGLDMGMTLMQKFDSPNFRCVATGPNRNKAEHAIAYKDAKWYDPSTDLWTGGAPTIGIRSVWVLA